jgi:hypothetical protein
MENSRCGAQPLTERHTGRLDPIGRNYIGNPQQTDYDCSIIMSRLCAVHAAESVTPQLLDKPVVQDSPLTNVQMRRSFLEG